MLSFSLAHRVVVLLALVGSIGACIPQGGQFSGPAEAASSSTSWYRVDTGVTPVAVVTFSPGQPGAVELVGTRPEVAEIQALLPELSSPDGFREKMHLPSKQGRRGPLGAVSFPIDHPQYADVYLSKIRGLGLNIDAIEPNDAPAVSGVSRLLVEDGRALVGEIDLRTTPPTLSQPEGELTSPMRLLKIRWDQAIEMKTLQVWYVVRDGRERRLETRKATIGDPDYGEVLHSWLHHAERSGGKRLFKVTAVP